MNASTFRSWTTLSVLILWLSGCGGGPSLGPVQGRVTLDGEPLPDATVLFTPEAGGRSAMGRTDAQGNFEMLFSARSKGALVGPCIVRITTAEEVTDGSGNARMKRELVPKKYNANSELTVEVGNKTNMFEFDLASK